ncbi:VirB3 family type IV secretion system protein [Paraburkholderia sp. SIMBA_009]|jgi:type IV secretory pathway VirB3-like protein
MALSDKEELITVEKVALGMTKPVMKGGIPISALAIIFAFSAELVLFGFLFFKNPFFGLVGLPLYGMARIRSRVEERFIELMAAAARTRWFNRARRRWGAATLSPLRHRKSKVWR